MKESKATMKVAPPLTGNLGNRADNVLIQWE